MNAPALAFVEAEPTAADILAELHELAASLVRLTASHVGEIERNAADA